MDDFVFTQYYPVLRAAKAPRATGLTMNSESEEFQEMAEAMSAATGSAFDATAPTGSVDSEVPLVSTSDMPLLCVPLPEGAEGLRFSDEALDMGLSRDPSGALALHGPLPPGPSTLALSYRLPVSGEPVSFERRFGADLPLLGVLLADNGILPETTRLHRRRPVRTEDRSYLHLEAFSVAAGEPIDLVLHRIERGGACRASRPRASCCWAPSAPSSS